MTRVTVAALLVLALASAAESQPFAFDRTFEAGPATALEIATNNGKIAVRDGEPGRIVVRGTVAVRAGVAVPADALALARDVAANPPVTHAGDVVTLSTPSDDRMRRAVTVSYEVQVPPATRVATTSESGATRVEGMTGAVRVRTQSGAVSVARLGDAAIVTGSGSVIADRMNGPLDIATSSGGITATGVAGGFRGRTQSGAVRVTLTGPGPVDVRTGSSGVRLTGVSGATIVETGSGRIEVDLAPGAAAALDASTGSGSVDVRAVTVDGTVEKRRVAGAIGTGGAEVRLVSRSGSIRVRQ